MKLSFLKALYCVADILSDMPRLNHRIIEKKLYLGTSLVALSVLNSCKSHVGNAPQKSTKDTIPEEKFTATCYLPAPPESESKETSHLKDTFNLVEQEPAFPWGLMSLNLFIKENLQIPDSILIKYRNKPVTIQFLIDKDGKLSQFKFKKGVNGLINLELIRVLKLMPNWIPGKQDGRIVNTWYTLSLNLSDFIKKELVSETCYIIRPALDNELKIADVTCYEAGPPIEPAFKNKPDSGIIYNEVDEQVKFPSGSDSLFSFIEKNLQYPQKAIENNIEGRVFVQFVVTPLGKIEGIKILRGIGDSCDEEAIRIIRLIPEWIPAKLNGKYVHSYFTLFIPFNLPQ